MPGDTRVSSPPSLPPSTPSRPSGCYSCCLCAGPRDTPGQVPGPDAHVWLRVLRGVQLLCFFQSRPHATRRLGLFLIRPQTLR